MCSNVFLVIVQYDLISTDHCYFLLFLPSTDPQNSKGIIVSSRIGLSLVGVILAAFSVVATVGLLSFMRVKATPIIIEVLPLLVLVIGTNNLYILTDAYEVSMIIFH